MYRYQLVDTDTDDRPLRFQIKRTSFLIWNTLHYFSVADLQYFAMKRGITAPWDLNTVAQLYFEEWVTRDRAAVGRIPKPKVIARA